MEGSHRASVGGHHRQKEKVTPPLLLHHGRLASSLRGLIRAAVIRDQTQQNRANAGAAKAPHPLFFFFWLADLNLRHLCVIVSYCFDVSNLASSARFDLCSGDPLGVFWSGKVYDFPVLFCFFSTYLHPGGDHLYQCHLNIRWWAQNLNHHFRSSPADLHLKHRDHRLPLLLSNLIVDTIKSYRLLHFIHFQISYLRLMTCWIRH